MFILTIATLIILGAFFLFPFFLILLYFLWNWGHSSSFNYFLFSFFNCLLRCLWLWMNKPSSCLLSNFPLTLCGSMFSLFKQILFHFSNVLFFSFINSFNNFLHYFVLSFFVFLLLLTFLFLFIFLFFLSDFIFILVGVVQILVSLFLILFILPFFKCQLFLSSVVSTLNNRPVIIVCSC